MRCRTSYVPYFEQIVPFFLGRTISGLQYEVKDLTKYFCSCLRSFDARSSRVGLSKAINSLMKDALANRHPLSGVGMYA